VLTSEEIRNRFTYHAPSPAGVAAHERLSEAFIALATLCDELVPDGRELALCFTALEDAKCRASAGIARNPETC